MDAPPSLRSDARRHERRAVVAAAIGILALLPSALHPLAAPIVALGIAAVVVGGWRLARSRPEQGWYALGVALLLQVGVVAVWVVPARSFTEVLIAVALTAVTPGTPLIVSFVMADRARGERRRAWGKDFEERRVARTYSRLTSPPPVPIEDEWAFADRALAAQEDELAYLERAAATAPRPADPGEEVPPAPRFVGMPATVARTVSPDGIGAVHVIHGGRRIEVTATCSTRVPVGRAVMVIGADSPRSVVVRPRRSGADAGGNG